MEPRACLYCKAFFTPNKYSPHQKICSSAECQSYRQSESMRVWRQKHPQYFKYDESKGPEWLDLQRKRSRDWRQKNPEKVRSYRQANGEKYRDYMRDYMRLYRENKKSTKNADNS